MARQLRYTATGHLCYCAGCSAEEQGLCLSALVREAPKGRQCVGYGGIPCDEPVRGPGMIYCESCARDRKLERGR